MLTFTFKIKKHDTLERKLETYLNITRSVYNLAKEVRDEAYLKKRVLSRFDLINQLPDLKKGVPWIAEVGSQTLQEVISRLDIAYSRYIKELQRCKYDRSRTIPSKPGWAKKKDWKSIPFRKTSVKIYRDYVYLTGLGKIRIFKSRAVEGNVKLARVVKKVDGWYLQIVTDVTVRKCENQAVLGVDVGLTNLIVTSEGRFLKRLRQVKKQEELLKKSQKRLKVKVKGSNNYEKEIKTIQGIYLKIRRIREDYLHKISRDLANTNQYIVVEHLDIKRMVKNRKYSKLISEASWGKFFTYLSYKAEVLRVDPKYSSQECNSCGHIAKANRRTQKAFKCIRCGHEGNADLEAALTIKKRRQSLLRDNFSKGSNV